LQGAHVQKQIYVQIPAYRDRELAPTLGDLFRQAAHPERLRVAVAWQYDTSEADLERELRHGGKVELEKIPAAESQGCNWARSLLQRKWDGEKYTLFLDSHHRFAPGWDRAAIALHEARRAAGLAKPVLTSYLPPYDPHSDPAGRERGILKIYVYEKRNGMPFRLRGRPLNEEANLLEPIAAHFVSLHFLFADGIINEEIPCDPSIYFFADEIAISLRAYTHGYDLFHPRQVLGWHLYDRATRTTHWADHSNWQLRDEESVRALRDLFSGRTRGRYGLGSARTLAEYERYIGMRLIGEDEWQNVLCASLTERRM
jgi:hypothetical protein